MGPYVSNASDARALELATIKLLHSGPEISGGLKFDKASATWLASAQDKIQCRERTLRHWRSDLSRSRRHQVRTDAQSPSDPRARVRVSGSPGVVACRRIFPNERSSLKEPVSHDDGERPRVVGSFAGLYHRNQRSRCRVAMGHTLSDERKSSLGGDKRLPSKPPRTEL